MKKSDEAVQLRDLETIEGELITLVFALRGEDFGLDVNSVREIVRVPPCTSVNR